MALLEDDVIIIDADYTEIPEIAGDPGRSHGPSTQLCHTFTSQNRIDAFYAQDRFSVLSRCPMPLTVTQVGAGPGAKPHIPPPPPPESQPGEIQSGAGRLVSLRRMLRPRNGTSLRPKVIHSAKANRRPG
eukprot:724196_1